MFCYTFFKGVATLGAVSESGGIKSLYVRAWTTEQVEQGMMTRQRARAPRPGRRATKEHVRDRSGSEFSRRIGRAICRPRRQLMGFLPDRSRPRPWSRHPGPRHTPLGTSTALRATLLDSFRLSRSIDAACRQGLHRWGELTIRALTNAVGPVRAEGKFVAWAPVGSPNGV